MKKNALPYLVVICLFAGLLSCKKEFSSDEPLSKEFRPQLIVELEPYGLIGLDLNSGAKLWENFSFWNWYNDTTPARLFDFYHPVKFDSFLSILLLTGQNFKLVMPLWNRKCILTALMGPTRSTSMQASRLR